MISNVSTAKINTYKASQKLNAMCNKTLVYVQIQNSKTTRKIVSFAIIIMFNHHATQLSINKEKKQQDAATARIIQEQFNTHKNT